MKILPFVIPIVILVTLFHRYSLEIVLKEAQTGTTLYLFPFALIAMIASLLIAASADTLVIRGCCGTPRFRDVLRAKAGSSLLNILGYAVGHSAYAVWVARFSGVSAGAAAGMLIFISVSDLTSICTAASLSIAVAGDGVADPTLSWITFLLAGSFLLAMLGIPLFLTPNPEKRSFLDPWSLLPFRISLTQVGLRMCQLLIWILSTSLAAHHFGLQIPLSAFATYLPIVLLVASLPVNVAGFGAVQAVWVHFFQDYGGAERVLAFQLIWQVLLLGSVVLRGLPFIRRVVDEIDRGQTDTEPTGQ